MRSRSRIARTAPAMIAAAAMCATLATAGAAPRRSAALRFAPPKLVSPDLGGAWEPTMLVDRFGTIYVTARKDTSSQILVGLDDRSPTKTRSRSWLWFSRDAGKTFENMEALPMQTDNRLWGYEGDLALDRSDHLYFVDQNYADSSMTRWRITGRGTYTHDFTRPVVPTGQPVDDRPWLAAHGNGSVFYIAQSGDATLNPVSDRTGDAHANPGRFAIYRSSDGGMTFDVRGRTLSDSGGCRPAADGRRGSGLVVVACTDDGGAHNPIDTPAGRGNLFAYVSVDDGVSFARYRIGDYNADAETFDWPHVTVAPNGDIWVLHVDAGKVTTNADGTFQIETNRLHLFRSRNKGRTWTRQDITPRAGRYRWGWLAASPSGDLAIGIQHRTSPSQPWRVYASVFAPGKKPSLISIDESHPVSAASNPEPPSEMVGLAFAPDRTLAVAWTRVETVNGLNLRRVYFTKSTAPARAPAR